MVFPKAVGLLLDQNILALEQPEGRSSTVLTDAANATTTDAATTTTTATATATISPPAGLERSQSSVDLSGWLGDALLLDPSWGDGSGTTTLLMCGGLFGVAVLQSALAIARNRVLTAAGENVSERSASAL